MIIEWIDRDFKDMLFNPWKIPLSEDLLKVWPDLAAHTEFTINTAPISKNKAIRYVIYMYDKCSPLLTKIDNIYKQKIEAAKLAGFKQNTAGTFPAYVDKMMVGLDHRINHMIIRYLRLMRDEQFMQFMIYKEKLYSSLQKMQETDDPKQLNQIIAVNKSLTGVINNLKTEFVQPKDSKQLIEILYEQAEFEDLELTPELIAERIEKGLDPVENYPYGKDYKFEKYSEDDESEGGNTISISGSG